VRADEIEAILKLFHFTAELPPPDSAPVWWILLVEQSRVRGGLILICLARL
jgi:hypothetical protein